MSTPQMPAGWAVGHTVFDHHAHRQLDHAMRVMASRRCQSGQIGIEILAALRAVVVRVRHQEVDRTARVQIPEIMQGALPLFVAIRLMATFGTGLSCMVI
jgi:hypothetical protein